jgi:hypothetical protein
LNLETCKTNISYLAAQRNLTWTEGEEWCFSCMLLRVLSALFS